MAGSELQELRKMFEDKKLTLWSLFKSEFSRGLCNTSVISPIIIDYCNGAQPCPFSDAFIRYSYPSDSYEYELWFKQFYIDLAQQLKLKQREDFNREQLRTIECLVDAVCNDQHVKCLQGMLKGDINEAELSVLLALHYFKPLVYESSCVIDNKIRHCGICKSCGEEPIYGDTLFGSINVWHGIADILIHKSAVTVCLEEDIDKMNLSNNREGDIDEMNLSYNGEEDDNITCRNQSEVNESFIQSSFFEVKTDRSISNISANKALSEAITNAFCQVRKNNALYKKFIPSFLVSEKYITVIFYNCEADQLLMSTRNPIWDAPNKLNFSTIVKVWTALNYFHELDETISKRSLLTLFPCSGFKTLMGKAYFTYSDEVQMPLDQKVKVDDSTGTCLHSQYDPYESKWRLLNLSYIAEALH